MSYKKMLAAGIAVGMLTLSGGLALAQDAGPAAVGATLETHINPNGTVLVRGAKITSISGSSISATQTWGSYSVSWVVNTAHANLVLRYGGKATIADFAVGDYVSFEGSLDQSQSAATVNANTVKDFSAQRQHATFSGSVASVGSSTNSFVLATQNRGNITVLVSSSTSIKQGDTTAAFGSIAVGQKITKAEGIWNTFTNQLQAQSVVIYQNTKLLEKRTFEGTLGSLAASSTPTTFSFLSGSTNYTVKVASNTVLVSNGWNTISLGQLSSGDKVRVYGAVEAANLSTIDALIVRDTKIK
jgi:hypothetical protein